MKALILAGGSGTRLWPLSRSSQPKQVCPFFDQETLLQKTWQRIAPVFSPDQIWLSVGKGQLEVVRQQLPGVANFVVEPAARNTAPAIGLAALRIYLSDPESVIVTVNSDQFIGDESEYLRILAVAEKVVNRYPDYILLVGVETEHAETGYGYIKRGEYKDEVAGKAIYTVDSFVEKPVLAKAQAYHQDHNFMWNPAIFVFQARKILDLFAKYLPQHFELLMAIKDLPVGSKKADEFFLQMESVSIDYGIMEKTDKLLVLPATFRWRDVGSFDAIYEIMSQKKKNSQENIVNTKYVEIDSGGNLVYAATDKVVATVGLHDFVVIDTDDALLIAPRSRAQEVKKLVAKMKDKNLNKYL